MTRVKISDAEWQRRQARKPGDPPTVDMARFRLHLCGLTDRAHCPRCRVEADELCKCGHFGRDHEGDDVVGCCGCERFTWWHDPSEWTP
jgi:hypothetical protein